MLAVLPTGDMLNAGHCVHAELPVKVAYLPSKQSRHILELFCPVAIENLPAKQSSHVSELLWPVPAAEYLPEGHRVQAGLAGVAE